MKNAAINAGSCEVVTGSDQTGIPVFSVLVKRTYRIKNGKTVSRAEADKPLTAVDEYYDEGDPQVNAIRFENDLTPFKLASDVVAVAKAYSPGGTAASSVRVSVTIGDHYKELLITGKRTCEFHPSSSPIFKDPEPFFSMDIRYERAYGGWDRQSDVRMPFWYPRNPVGRGFVVKNLRETVEGLELPNIEDPEEPLTPETLITGDLNRWNRQPLSQGFGWFHRAWYPRCSFLAAMPAFVPIDEVMREERLGLVPASQSALSRAFRLPSQDPRFYNGASLGLKLPYLKGDEQVTLTNCTIDGKLTFFLAGESPRINMNIGFGDNQLKPLLYSLILRPEDHELDLVWGGTLQYPGSDWLPEMKKLEWNVQ